RSRGRRVPDASAAPRRNRAASLRAGRRRGHCPGDARPASEGQPARPSHAHRRRRCEIEDCLRRPRAGCTPGGRVMPRVVHLPQCDDLRAAPELAALAVLESSINVAVLALGAAYPEIQGLADVHESNDLRAALAIMDIAHALGAAVNRYKLAIVVAREHDELLPF